MGAASSKSSTPPIVWKLLERSQDEHWHSQLQSFPYRSLSEQWRPRHLLPLVRGFAYRCQKSTIAHPRPRWPHHEGLFAQTHLVARGCCRCWGGYKALNLFVALSSERQSCFEASVPLHAKGMKQKQEPSSIWSCSCRLVLRCVAGNDVAVLAG